MSACPVPSQTSGQNGINSPSANMQEDQLLKPVKPLKIVNIEGKIFSPYYEITDL